MPQVRPPLDTFAHEPDALAVANRAVVEPVAGELEAAVAELEQQIPLQGSRGFVGDTAPAKVRVDREPAQVRDPVDLAPLVEPHHARTLTVDQHDQATESLRLGERPLDVLGDRLAGRAMWRK